MVSVFEPLKFYCVLDAIIIIIMMKATSLESFSVGFFGVSNQVRRQLACAPQTDGDVY